MTGIDTPQLNFLLITFFNQIDFDTPRVAQFINCTPALRALDRAHVQFDDNFAQVEFSASSQTRNLSIAISCREPDWQLSSIEQVCNSSLDPLSMVEDFYIEHRYLRTVWKNDVIEKTLWLQLLPQFTAVKNLYLFKEFAPGIVAALQELAGGRITEVLPSLQNIFVKELEPSGPFQENIERFVTAQRLSSHPIAISDWDKGHAVFPPPVSHRAGQQLVSTVYEDPGSERTGSFVTERSGSDDEEDAENDMVAPFAHWHALAGPPNPTTLSATTQPGGKSDPDRATEGTTALGSSIGGSVDSGDGTAGALPEHGLGRNRDRNLLEREGGHVGEAVQCRSLDLSRTSSRGLECTHRRTCHQEYQRIVIIATVFQFFMLFGLLSCTILHTVHRLCDKRNRRALS